MQLKNDSRPTHTRARGEQWESVAESFLRSQGLNPWLRNYHCRWGEIDLLMRHDDTLVFVEVRYRRRNSCGDGAESVTLAKQHRLLRAARHFLAYDARGRRWGERPCRFDVISLSGDGSRPDWLQNAIWLDQV